jgi:hypothetical protein
LETSVPGLGLSQTASLLYRCRLAPRSVLATRVSALMSMMSHQWAIRKAIAGRWPTYCQYASTWWHSVTPERARSGGTWRSVSLTWLLTLGVRDAAQKKNRRFCARKAERCHAEQDTGLTRWPSRFLERQSNRGLSGRYRKKGVSRLPLHLYAGSVGFAAVERPG